MVIIQEWINFVKLFFEKEEKSYLLFTNRELCYHLDMTNSKRFLLINILDILTFLLMVLGISFSIFDVRFMGDYPRLSSLPIYETFTGLSNIFLGIICLACALYRIIKKEMTLPAYLLLIKIIALADITITFVITATYLAPSIGSSWWRLYINNNIFNHFLTPLLAIIAFLILENYTEFSWKYCFLSLIPLFLYGFFYLDNVYTHLTPEGKTDLAYDIYGFCRFGVGILILFLIGFMVIAFGLTLLYWFLNKQKRSS